MPKNAFKVATTHNGCTRGKRKYSVSELDHHILGDPGAVS